MAVDLSNLGYPVSSRGYSFGDMVERSWGPEFRAPDHGIYMFSNGRRFDSTDQNKTGIYGVVVTNGLLIENAASRQYPDMYHGVLLDELFDKIAQD